MVRVAAARGALAPGLVVGGAAGLAAMAGFAGAGVGSGFAAGLVAVAALGAGATGATVLVAGAGCGFASALAADEGRGGTTVDLAAGEGGAFTEGCAVGVGGAAGLEVEQSAGPSARAGIAPGDVILAVNGHPLKTAGQLRDWVAKADKHVALLVRRHDEKLYVAVDLG